MATEELGKATSEGIEDQNVADLKKDIQDVAAKLESLNTMPKEDIKRNRLVDGLKIAVSCVDSIFWKTRISKEPRKH